MVSLSSSSFQCNVLVIRLSAGPKELYFLTSTVATSLVAGMSWSGTCHCYVSEIYITNLWNQSTDENFFWLFCFFSYFLSQYIRNWSRLSKAWRPYGEPNNDRTMTSSRCSSCGQPSKKEPVWILLSTLLDRLFIGCSPRVETWTKGPRTIAIPYNLANSI